LKFERSHHPGKNKQQKNYKKSDISAGKDKCEKMTKMTGGERGGNKMRI